MANALSKTAATALSVDIVNSLVSGIAESRSTTPIAGLKPILRLLKSGVWVFGQGNEPVQIGSQWAINPMSIQHGWVCWSNSPDNKTKNELLGEVMATVREHKPIKPEDIQGFPYKEQRVFDLKCM